MSKRSKIQFTSPNRAVLCVSGVFCCQASGSHSSVDEDSPLLACYTVSTGKQLSTFQRRAVPRFIKQSKKTFLGCLTLKFCKGSPLEGKVPNMFLLRITFQVDCMTTSRWLYNFLLVIIIIIITTTSSRIVIKLFQLQELKLSPLFVASSHHLHFGLHW